MSHPTMPIALQHTHDLASYRRYENGLHEIIFHDNSRAAVDKFQEYIESMYQHQLEIDEPYFILIDASGYNDLPLRYIMKTARGLNHIYQNVPDGGRAAYVFERSPMMAALDVFLQIVRGSVERRFMDVRERDQARAWVLQGLTNNRNQKT